MDLLASLLNLLVTVITAPFYVKTSQIFKGPRSLVVTESRRKPSDSASQAFDMVIEVAPLISRARANYIYRYFRSRTRHNE